MPYAQRIPGPHSREKFKFIHWFSSSGSARVFGHLVFRGVLRTFAQKSSYGEIFFISPLELVHKVPSPKMEKNGGHRLCFGENGSGKMP